jgi:hypothetical protein
MTILSLDGLETLRRVRQIEKDERILAERKALPLQTITRLAAYIATREPTVMEEQP